MKSHILLPLFIATIAAAPAARATPDPRPDMDGATYAVRMRNIEARIDDDKERTRRNRLRLALLSDSMPGSVGAARAEISFHEDVTSDFVLVRAVVQLDGVVQYDKRDETGALANVRDIPIFNGSLVAGNHTLQISLTYRGNGFGVFAYMRGYRVEVQSSRTFEAAATHPVKVVVTGAQVGGPTTPFNQRVAVRWHVDSGPPPAIDATVHASSNATTSHVDPMDADPSIVAPLEAALSPYGSWVDDATFGHVWIPSATIVGAQFTPYVTGGHWTYDGVADVGGDFTWMSDWAWGWAPFHLGRWAQTSAGWAWIPGRTYAPAWVVWRSDRQPNGNETVVVGWSPAAPTWIWRNGAAVAITPPREPAVYVNANDVFGATLSSKVLANGARGAGTNVADHTTPRAMGITVLPVTTPIGDASLARARDFSTQPKIDTPVAERSHTAIDTNDADASVLGETHDTLATYGSWSDDALYGTVWTPSPSIVGADFTPYVTGGHWTRDGAGEYAWVSDYAWGLTFRRGRWVHIGAHWSWIPGKTQRAAWVTWTTDANGAVGWAPTPPTFAWRAGVAVAITAPQPVFVYVSATDILAPDLSARRRDRAQVVVPTPPQIHITLPTHVDVRRGATHPPARPRRR